MSTRATIKIIEKLENVKTPKVVNIYHHYDGYPSYLGVFLMKKLTEKIGNTYLLKKSFCDIDILSNYLIKNDEDGGFELTCYFHTDIEYLYTIDINHQTITCQAVHCKWDSKVLRYTIDETINLNDYMEKNLVEMAN